jgi:hypothetical protein
VTLVDDDDVIQTFTADWADNAFDAHYSNTITETLAIRCIPVSQQIARDGVPGKGFGDLTSEPSLRWTLGDLEVNDPSSMVIKA